MVGDRTLRMSVSEYQIMFSLKYIFYNLLLLFFVARNSRAHNILIDSLWNDHFGLFLMLDGGHLRFSHEGSTQFKK